MKTGKSIQETSDNINLDDLNVTNQQFFKNAYLPISLAVALTISFGFVAKTAWAENTKTQDIQHYPKTLGKTEPVQKPTDGKGGVPSFEQADINADHYITKNELKNFPYMLQVFDKVDAGEDGKLEQHEYENLIMETKREGQIR